MKYFILFNAGWLLTTGLIVSHIHNQRYDNIVNGPPSEATLIMDCYRSYRNYDYCYNTIASN